jgi:hypothetical protein
LVHHPTPKPKWAIWLPRNFRFSWNIPEYLNRGTVTSVQIFLGAWTQSLAVPMSFFVSVCVCPSVRLSLRMYQRGPHSADLCEI